MGFFFVQSDTWILNENIRYFSILILIFLYICTNDKLALVFLVSWDIFILLTGNIRHLSVDNRLTYTIRMTLYFLPYALPKVLFVPILFEVNSQVLIYCVVAVSVFCTWLLLNLKVFKISLSDSVIAATAKEPKYTLFLRIYTTIGAAITEELFFRSFILSINAPIIILVIISSLYFMLSHYILPWRQVFTRRDHINQIFFGCINSILFILSGSILPSILLHLLVNLITVLKIARIYDRHYIRIDYFNSLMEKNVKLEELEI